MDNLDMSKDKNKSLSPKERLKKLLEREKETQVLVEKAKETYEGRQKKLAEIKKDIVKVQKEIAGLEFLNIAPNEFVAIHDNLEKQQIPTGEILKLLADGNFEKLQEIYNRMQEATL